ncbi:hypothetical protein [Nakamurella sp.]|uniref:hypothetical protein n=1 Tax=Nakamurella sp. TaxID=1869182 RepID=UPI003B3B6D30
MIEAGTVLAVWERAATLVEPARASALAAAAVRMRTGPSAPGNPDGPDADGRALRRPAGRSRRIPTGDPGTAAGWALGRRDAALLRLYRAVRGPVVEALATCSACDTTLDVRLPVADLLIGYPDPDPDPDGDQDPVGEFDLGGATVRARCPTTTDLQAVAQLANADQAAHALIDRCVQWIHRPGEPAGGLPSMLTPTEREALGAALERLDPLVDVRIDIACGHCGSGWSALLDVPSLAWAQVHGRARRLLREVDVLAARYGWSEADILGMTQARRDAYLDLD